MRVYSDRRVHLPPPSSVCGGGGGEGARRVDEMLLVWVYEERALSIPFRLCTCVCVCVCVCVCSIHMEHGDEVGLRQEGLPADIATQALVRV